MTREALISDIRKKGEVQIESVWRHTRKDSADLRAAVAREINEHDRRTARESSAFSRAALEAATARAEVEVRSIRTTAQVSLADRLYVLAGQMLPKFRNSGYAGLFAALVDELPTLEWRRVTVNPEDRALAQTHFPGAQIVCDEQIVGGLTVAVEGGRIRIDNTLERRLQRAWLDMLPELMPYILEEIDGNGSVT